MENTAIINPTAFEALKDFNLAEAIEENMDGMDISFDRIGTPGAGGMTFEVPGENPGEMDSVKEFTGVILYHHPMSFYYTEAYSGQKTQPTCCTYDGITGVGTPGGDCKKCPLNQYESGANGGKACRNKRRVYLIREGELIPVLLTLPTGSLKIFANYVKRLLAKGKKPSGVVTRFSIAKAQGNGPAYSQLQFTVDRTLTPDEQASIAALATQVKEFANRVAIDENPNEIVDAETGEIIKPLT